ncbi:defensin-like protein 19 [Durio zibethinus]|uniref:Defensin-like protein 19 n=1 Tax=Durio zibethinus TaxID=66656 RepID=A0A6P6AMC5_DURZI|nr:defensin-like protein 19 [Durio zibethinus]
MAKLFGRLPTYTFLLIFFSPPGLLWILFYNGYLFILIHRCDAQNCQRQITTWSGFCGNSRHCNHQRRSWEGALHGACRHQFLGFACFCYVRC